jgi:hypothetical protein
MGVVAAVIAPSTYEHVGLVFARGNSHFSL